MRTTPKEHQKSKTRSYDKPTIFLQYRGNLTQNLASKLKKLCELQVVFTTRKLRTRITEHQKKDSQVGQHLVECRGATNDIEWKILDACRTAEKLMISEAIYIKPKPALNKRDEYRGRELSLKY